MVIVGEVLVTQIMEKVIIVGFSYLADQYTRHTDGMEDELQRLKDALPRIQAVVAAGDNAWEFEQQTADPHLQAWLQQLKDVLYEADDALDELKYLRLQKLVEADDDRDEDHNKLSCIDCGQMFDQESVQSHNQCITEAEKYGPKGQGNVSNNGQNKPDKPKKNSDVDISVGLSSRPPWFCSLCNTQATSRQTLLLHADGKKHRAKARAYYASQKQSSQTEEPTHGEEAVSNNPLVESAEANGSGNKVLESDLQKNSDVPVTEGKKESHTRKRKVEASEDGISNKNEEKNACDFTNGEVIQAEQCDSSQHKSKKKKGSDKSSNCKDQVDKGGPVVEASKGKIKWKKLVTSTLKGSDGVMKIKRLQKFVIKAVKEFGVTEDEVQLRDKLMHKISSSTRFTIGDKRIWLVTETEKS